MPSVTDYEILLRLSRKGVKISQTLDWRSIDFQWVVLPKEEIICCSIAGCIGQYTHSSMPSQQNEFATEPSSANTLLIRSVKRVSSSCEIKLITFRIRVGWQAMRTLLALYSPTTQTPLQTENQCYASVDTLSTLLVTGTIPSFPNG